MDYLDIAQMLHHQLPLHNVSPDDAQYEYPASLREQINTTPRVPGVYTFHGNAGSYPLYIGKSINIRARLLSHLRAANEARLIRQTSYISYIRTAGEISALLLEAQMIKMQQPLFNRRLRKTRDTCSLVLNEARLQIQYTNGIINAHNDNVYGLFKNQRSAKDRLRQLADKHALCLSVMGIEPDTKGRGCFRSAIKKCAGACCGNEAIKDHTARMRLALDAYKISAWPFAGAIALKESFGRLRQYHVLHNWRYHGSYKSARGLAKYQLRSDVLFDADMYKILVKPILFETAEIIEI